MIYLVDDAKWVHDKIGAFFIKQGYPICSIYSMEEFVNRLPYIYNSLILMDYDFGENRNLETFGMHEYLFEYKNNNNFIVLLTALPTKIVTSTFNNNTLDKTELDPSLLISLAKQRA